MRLHDLTRQLDVIGRAYCPLTRIRNSAFWELLAVECQPLSDFPVDEQITDGAPDETGMIVD